MENRRIVLIGYRGTGKSSIGRTLASILSLPHYDTDTIIEEKQQKLIPEIFREIGEEGFREIESDMIKRLPHTPSVISTGGGAVIKHENIRELRRNSQLILLTSSEKILAERIAGSSRPSLTTMSLEDEIHSVLTERMPNYLSSADYRYDTSGKHPREAAEAILQTIRPGNQYTAEVASRKKLTDHILQTPVPEVERSIIRNICNDPKTRLYGILGYPCMHSLSPRLWNRLFRKYEIPAHYSWFECQDPSAFLSLAEKAGVRGVSVTIPHKESVMSLLDEVRHDARTIGAVNTILLLDGRRYGYNTDWKGIYRPLEGVKGDTAVIIGAGGAAAAAVYAVSMRGFTPVILNRTVQRAEKLAHQYNAQAGPISSFSRYEPDLVINTTPLGMTQKENNPHSDQLPVPPSLLNPDMYIFDLVYTPAETPFLRAALEKGCSIIPGTEMFIHQLAEQFKILTGIEVQTDMIREWIL